MSLIHFFLWYIVAGGGQLLVSRVQQSIATTQNGVSAALRSVSLDVTNNRLFVSDGNNSRILIHNVTPATISNGQNALAVLGQDDFVSSSTTTTQSKITTPFGVAYVSNGNSLYIDDLGNRRIVLYKFVRITTTSLDTAQINSVYTTTLTTTNHQGTITYTITSGALPTGLSLSTPALESPLALPLPQALMLSVSKPLITMEL